MQTGFREAPSAISASRAASAADNPCRNSLATSRPCRTDAVFLLVLSCCLFLATTGGETCEPAGDWGVTSAALLLTSIYIRKNGKLNIDKAKLSEKIYMITR
jgi:hypothetical protein